MKNEERKLSPVQNLFLLRFSLFLLRSFYWRYMLIFTLQAPSGLTQIGIL